MSDDHERKPVLADLATIVSWSPRDQAEVERALLVAMDALDQRTASAHDLLEGPYLCGLIDPSQLRAQMASDGQATTVLRTLLTHPAESPEQAS